jgi:hypothetical protein
MPNVQYEIVVLDRNDNPVRTIFRSPHYAAALGYLSRNLDRRPNLDMMRGGYFVQWELAPALLAVPA